MLHAHVIIYWLVIGSAVWTCGNSDMHPLTILSKLSNFGTRRIKVLKNKVEAWLTSLLAFYITAFLVINLDHQVFIAVTTQMQFNIISLECNQTVLPRNSFSFQPGNSWEQWKRADSLYKAFLFPRSPWWIYAMIWRTPYATDFLTSIILQKLWRISHPLNLTLLFSTGLKKEYKSNSQQSFPGGLTPLQRSKLIDFESINYSVLWQNKESCNLFSRIPVLRKHLHLTWTNFFCIQLLQSVWP